LINVMLETIQKHNMLVKGDKVVVGLSGGPDSLAMIHALFQISGKVGIELVAVHVNHLLRGEHADADEDFVKAFCSALGIKCYAFKVNVAEYASDHGLSFEEAGRRVRYEKFDQVRTEVGGTKIAIGQNRNDLVETFFINLFRGSGIDGLSSIEFVRDGVFIRPLLEVDRIDIEKYCESNRLEARRDHTNDENDYVRNKIRNELIPFLKINFNPSINETIFRTTEVMKEEKYFWSQHVKGLFNDICTSEEEKIVIQGRAYAALTASEQKQLLRFCIKILRKHLVDISSEHLNQIRSLNRTNTSIRLDDDFSVSYEYGDFVVFKRKSENTDENPPELNAIHLELSGYTKDLTDQWTVALDADRIKGQLYVRKRINGDRFVPLGMKGHKKIKDFFIDEKVPMAKRDATWIVCDEEKIVWVHGMRIHDHCKITKDTKNIVLISIPDVVEKR
jgi:tRNA(Ile)-lysidine synthase